MSIDKIFRGGNKAAEKIAYYHVLLKQMHGNFPARDKKNKNKNTCIQVDHNFVSFLSTSSFDKAVEIK